MLLTTAGVPRLSPLAICRPRLERWLKVYAALPVRLLIAPAGCGKTTLLLKYATKIETAVAYCALPPNTDSAVLFAQIARALNVACVPQSYDELVSLLGTDRNQPLELIVDDIDKGNAEALNILLRLVEEPFGNVSLIYAGHSRERIHSQHLLARGLAVLCDAVRLAFDEDSAGLLAEAYGVPAIPLQLRRLAEDTDGWAMALCDTIRTAAAENLSLDHAYATWRTQSHSFLRDFLSEELRNFCDEDRGAFWALYNGTAQLTESRLCELESRGLFLLDDGLGTPRLLRAIRPIGAKIHADASRVESSSPLMVRLFRSFEASIDGREISWIRRRDQQIVKYLLLKQDAKATRGELASVFWTGTDRHLATQSVRTACSTIRKAIAGVVGPSGVDAYFRTAPDLQLDLRNVVCDVQRFTMHISDAKSCIANGDAQGATMHLRAAEKLYSGDLLELEAPEPWFAVHARHLQELYVFALECLGDMALENGDFSTAQQYALRVRNIAPDSANGILLRERLAFLHPADAIAHRKPAAKAHLRHA